ncbi:MAG: hypothetical protein IPK93_02565 [Solirubrobacterales bacterium]|nr:hypothetical protein [Solirubrobacterales bacterium]
MRPADLSTSQHVINSVKTLGAVSIAIFLVTANQVSNILPAQRESFRPVIWGMLLTLAMAAAIVIPVVIIAFGYFSVKALILLTALATLELVLFIVLVIAKVEPSSAYAAPPGAPQQVIPPVQLPPDQVARYEEATLALEQAARDHDDAIREADEAARRYEQATQAYGARPPLR